MQKEFINPLQKGSMLHGQSYNYIIEDVLGQGAFGTTYLAKVQMQGALSSLDSNMRVAVTDTNTIKSLIDYPVLSEDGVTVLYTWTGNEDEMYYKGTFKNEKEHNGKWYILGTNEVYSVVTDGKENVK